MSADERRDHLQMVFLTCSVSLEAVNSLPRGSKPQDIVWKPRWTSFFATSVPNLNLAPFHLLYKSFLETAAAGSSDLLFFLAFTSMLSIRLGTFLFPVLSFFFFYPLICSLSASIAPLPPLRNPILFSCCCFSAFPTLRWTPPQSRSLFGLWSSTATTTTTVGGSFSFSVCRTENTRQSDA